jgi:hypothetical integral membrane protein (TIGR02206 family)
VNIGFRAFSAQHICVLSLICAIGALVAWGSRRLTDSGRTHLGRALGWFLIAYAIVMYLHLGLSGEFGANWALPFELCHWVLIACAVTLFRPNQLASEIAYYWGLGGTLQAILTPDIGSGFPSWDFIMFFWGHAGALLAILFLIAAREFWPRPGSTLRMLLALNVYGIVAGLIDITFGWDYGYLCQKPSRPSLLDYLGPWPWYILSLEVLALAAFFLLSLPWIFLDRKKARFLTGKA